MLKEKIVKKKRAEQVNAVKLSSTEDLGEINAVSGGNPKAKVPTTSGIQGTATGVSSRSAAF